MMNWKRYVPLTFAVIFAVLSSTSVYFFLKDRTDVSHAAPVTVPVVIAKNPIALGEKLAERDLVVATRPEKTVPSDAFSSTRPIVGRTARVNIGANEAVLESKLLESGESFSSLIPPNMRGVTVAVRHSDALAQILERGTVVDVLSILVINGISTSGVVVEKARVIGVHKSDSQTNANMKSELRNMEVTLVVTPEEAEWLVNAMSRGPVQLAVRSNQEQVPIALA